MGKRGVVSSPLQSGDPGARDEGLQREGEGGWVVDIARRGIRHCQTGSWEDTDRER